MNATVQSDAPIPATRKAVRGELNATIALPTAKPSPGLIAPIDSTAPII